MIADDFSDIAVRLKQIEQKTFESQWCERFRDEQMIARAQLEAPNVEFVQ